MTPRQHGAGLGAVTHRERAQLPVIFFMASQVLSPLIRKLRQEGMSPSTPVALVFNTGDENEEIIRGRLGSIEKKLPPPHPPSPGLFLVGEISRYSYARTHGALQGKRVLLTCSEALQGKASDQVWDLGGMPIQRPLVRLTPCDEAAEKLRQAGRYEWLILTSPSAVQCLVKVMSQAGLGWRNLPKLMVCGGGTAAELRANHVLPDAEPAAGGGNDTILELAKHALRCGSRVLRLRSDKADNRLLYALRRWGIRTDDCVLYRNEAIDYTAAPQFDVAFFASHSAVESFLIQWGARALKGKTVVAIGLPTAQALRTHRLHVDLVSPETSMEIALLTLGGWLVGKANTKNEKGR